ncbi:MAG: tRNA lysidine(34) synthetase TilS [Anaerolineae bacterium]|nr:tRNA lysidine(34) synthetase TilS [Anaerolineae bacterium]
MPLLDRVTQTITRHALIAPGDRLVVGVSGGPDSLVLLHVLCRLREAFHLSLHAATLDHGIRGAASAADAEFVRRTATGWDVPVTVGRADVLAFAKQHRLGIEETARQVRYAFLVHVARQVGAAVVAVGHNRDDQTETVLMHLIRGSGLNGLCGMWPRTPTSAYHLLIDAPVALDPPAPGPPAAPACWPDIIRPLIDTPRAAIDAYVTAHGLQPRLDATNLDTTYFRNRLRHDVIPLLETLNPNLRAMLARTADVLQADAALIRQLGEAALARVQRDSPSGTVILDRDAWAGLSLSEQRHVIRAVTWRLRPALRDVSFVHVENALAVANTGATGAQATLPGGLLLRVGYETLSIAPSGMEAPESAAQDAPTLEDDDGNNPFLPGDSVQWTFGNWTFEAAPLTSPADLPAVHADPLAAALAVPPGAWLNLRTRRPGDRFCPRGLGGHSQKLGDTLINLKVPAPWRDRVPLFTVDDAIAWFVAPTGGGLRGRVAEPFAPDPLSTSGSVIVVVRWRRTP